MRRRDLKSLAGEAKVYSQEKDHRLKVQERANKEGACSVYLGLREPYVTPHPGDVERRKQQILDGVLSQLAKKPNLTRHEVCAAWSLAPQHGMDKDLGWSKLLTAVSEVGQPVLAVGLEKDHLKFYAEKDLQELRLQKEPLAMTLCEDGVYKYLGKEVPFYSSYGLSAEALSLQVRCMVDPCTGALTGETQQLVVELEREASLHPKIGSLVNQAEEERVASLTPREGRPSSKSSYDVMLARELNRSLQAVRPGGLLPNLEASAVKELELDLKASARLSK